MSSISYQSTLQWTIYFATSCGKNFAVVSLLKNDLGVAAEDRFKLASVFFLKVMGACSTFNNKLLAIHKYI